MNDTAAPTEYRQDEVELLLNGRVSFVGNQIKVRGGSARTHAAALNSGAQGYGGAEFFLPNGDQVLCCFVGDQFYYSSDEGVNWNTPAGATGLPTGYWSMVQMRVGASNYLICVNGGTSAYYFDGTTWGTLSGAPANAKFAAVFNGRLYLTGHNGTDVTASKVQDPNTWGTPDGFTVRVDTHDGDSEMSGLFALGTVLMAFKRKSTNYIEGFGYQTVEVEAGARGISRSVGCIAPRSISQVGDRGVCWLSERGFEYFEIGQLIQLISRPVQSFIDSLNWVAIKNGPRIPSAMFWSRVNEYMCSVPTVSTQNDMTFRWRPPTISSPAATAVDRYAQADLGGTLFVNGEGNLEYDPSSGYQQALVVGGNLTLVTTGGFYATLVASNLEIQTVSYNHAVLFAGDRDDQSEIGAPYSVGYDGFVRKLEIGTTDDSSTPTADDGSEVLFQVISRPFVFKDPVRLKRARTVRIQTEQDTEQNVLVTVLADGAAQVQHTVTMPTSLGGKPVRRKARVGGRGASLQVVVQSASGVELGGIEMIAEYLRESL